MLASFKNSASSIVGARYAGSSILRAALASALVSAGFGASAAHASESAQVSQAAVVSASATTDKAKGASGTTAGTSAAGASTDKSKGASGTTTATASSGGASTDKSKGSSGTTTSTSSTNASTDRSKGSSGSPPPGAFTDSAGAWLNVPGGPPATTNAFFQPLGSNARTCATCHAPNDAWTATPAGLLKRFNASAGADPVFLPLDGTNCPTLPLATADDHRTASSLLLSRGLVRVELTPPANAEFTVTSVQNPYGCSSTKAVSVYRRILPATNLAFLSDVMWDARGNAGTGSAYDSLVAQANTAIATHAAATNAADPTAVGAAVAFELEQFTAQVFDTKAGLLGAPGVTGGPTALSQQAFTSGENPAGSAQPAFTIYSGWESLVPPAGASTSVLAQASIGRGEKIFNSRPISLPGMPGLADGKPSTGTCGTCHNSTNAGSHSSSLLIAERTPPSVGIDSKLPKITLKNTQTGATIAVNDPGVALVSGRWGDIGKFKVPTLRGLAARAPYFHDGSAQTLTQVVTFYNKRFNLNLSAQEQADLTAFLQAL